MEIHKPKPVHSFREFVTELFTIVLGIVIAICLEQTVEYFHWRHEVAAGRKALAKEIAASDALYALRIKIAPCMVRQLDQTAALVGDIAAKRKPGPSLQVWRAFGANLSDAEWQSERSSQVLTHFPREELALMSRFYAQNDDARGWMVAEGDVWAQLNVLREDANGLGPADLALLRVNIHKARRLGRLIAQNAPAQLARSEELAIPYAQPAPSQIEERCNPGAHLAEDQ